MVVVFEVYDEWLVGVGCVLVGDVGMLAVGCCGYVCILFCECLGGLGRRFFDSGWLVGCVGEEVDDVVLLFLGGCL